MSTIQIVLLIIGAVLFVVSFVVPDISQDRKKENEDSINDAMKLKDMAQEALDEVGKKLSEMVDETVNYANEKAERSMERVSNEKIMAISEYSDTVIADMEKAHKEILFLYDMLNDKTAALNNTIREADALRQTLNQVNEEGLFPELDTITEDEIIEDSMEKIVRDTEEMVAVDTAKKSGKKKKDTSGKNNDKVAKNTSLPDIYGGATKNKNDKILALHKEGKSNVAIAKELGLGVGEVKLVIDLFKGAK